MHTDPERNAFKEMPYPSQIMGLFDSMRYLHADVAVIKKVILEMKNDLFFQKTTKQEDTAEKIEAVLSKRFNFGKYLLDKVAPNIITVIILSILYLVFSE